MPTDAPGPDDEQRRRWDIREEPPPAPVRADRTGGPLFYAGCGTVSLAAIVGYPLGMILADELFGDPGFGGFVGIFLMILVFGFFTRCFQLMAERGKRLPGPLGDKTFWTSTGIGAFFGFFFGPVGSGLLAGVVVGAVVGLVLYYRRRGAG